MADPHDARMELGNWFATILKELDEDFVNNPKAISDLKDKVALAFAEWRIKWGYGIQGPGTGPETTE
jgi:hypothetical protein